MNVPLSCPDITEREVDLVTRVLWSGQLSLGPRVAEFEEKFAAYAGARYAIAVNSGTSALHLAVRALGIGAGDEVLTTAFSFVASSYCLMYEHALPVFVDIDPHTLNLDSREVHRFIEERCIVDPTTGTLRDVLTGLKVRAILPVHVFGLPCDMDSILDLASKYNLRVIEDACEALGAQYKGRPVGTLGDIGVFAFYPNKQMTTGEGGMIVTDDEPTAMLCRSMRNQGRGPEGYWLRHVRLGYNYRLSDIHSALGLAQLERIEELLGGRMRVAQLYEQALGGHPLLKLPPSVPDCQRSWFVYPVQLLPPAAVPDGSVRDRVLSELRARGVGCQSYFPAIHLQPCFQEGHLAQQGPLPHTEAASNTCLVLPMFSSATEEQIGYVSKTLLEILEGESRGLAAHCDWTDRFRGQETAAV
ncbi:MAG: polysaccharide biosynthesis protein [Acidobacteria bacterium]|nr:MAG: polysaccharide biosynthesis protein [Acidobacteriota bacterium]